MVTTRRKDKHGFIKYNIEKYAASFQTNMDDNTMEKIIAELLNSITYYSV